MQRLEAELREARLGASAPRQRRRLGACPTMRTTSTTSPTTSARPSKTRPSPPRRPPRTPEELETEIAVLDRLLVKSLGSRRSSRPTPSGTRLRDTLDDADEMRDATGARRKVIIFTEHKDTLDDLVARLTQPPRPRRRRRHHPRRHQARGPQEGPGDVRAGRATASSSSPPTPPVRASTSRTRTCSSTTTCRGTPTGSSSGSAASTASASPTSATCGPWSRRTPARATSTPGCWRSWRSSAPRSADASTTCSAKLFEGNSLRDLMIAGDPGRRRARDAQRYLIEVVDAHRRRRHR